MSQSEKKPQNHAGIHHDDVFIEFYSEEFYSLSKSLLHCEHANQFLAFDTKLLDYIRKSKNFTEFESQAICRLMNIVFLFKTEPLSQNELVVMKKLKLPEKDERWLLTENNNLERLSTNKSLSFINYSLPKRLPTLDSSVYPLIDEGIIWMRIRRIHLAIKNVEAPFLKKALINLCIATPKLISNVSSLKSAVDVLILAIQMLDTVESRKPWKYMYQALDATIDFHLAERIKKMLVNMPQHERIQPLYTRVFKAMVFALIINKQDKKKFDADAQELMDMMIEIGDSSEVLVLFLTHVDVKRLLYKMRNLYKEYKNRENLHSQLAALNHIRFALELVLLDRLDETLSSKDEDKGKLICLLVEYITLWSATGELAFHMALIWTSFTEISLQAVNMLNQLIPLLQNKPDFLSSANTLYGTAENERTSRSIISKAPTNVKRVKELRETHSTKLQRGDNILAQLSSDAINSYTFKEFLICTYFNTSKSDYNKGKLYYPLYNLHSGDLANDKNLYTRLITPRQIESSLTQAGIRDYLPMKITKNESRSRSNIHEAKKEDRYTPMNSTKPRGPKGSNTKEVQYVNLTPSGAEKSPDQWHQHETFRQQRFKSLDGIVNPTYFAASDQNRRSSTGTTLPRNVGNDDATRSLQLASKSSSSSTYV